MSDLIDRQEAIEHCKKRLWESAYNNVQVVCDVSYTMQEIADNRIENWLKELPSAQPEIIRCKDCKHRPKRWEEGEGDGFNLEFPDYKCPCQCDDGWYNWMPDDNWFCGDGERKES